MHKRTLTRHGMGWSRPYGTHPFSPVFYADGGNGDSSGSSSDAGNGAAGGQPSGQSGENPDSGSGASGDDPAATIARLEKQLADARAEAGKARTTAKQNAANEAVQQLTQDIGRALGLVKDDETPDPAELTTKLTAAQTQARQTAVELAVYKAAGAAGADPDALLDSRAFVASLANLDPADATAVSAAVALAVQTNPKLRTHPGAGRSGADLNGGSGDQPAGLDKQIAQARADGNWRLVMQLENTKLAAAEAAQ